MSFLFLHTACLLLYVDYYHFAYYTIQGVSLLDDFTAAGDLLGLSDQKISYKHASDFVRLRSYGRLKLRIEGNDY